MWHSSTDAATLARWHFISICAGPHLGQPHSFVGLVLLLSRGADVNLQHMHGGTALMAAAEEGRVAAVRMLIDGGARPEITDDDGWTALHFAQDSGHSAVAAMLSG